MKSQKTMNLKMKAKFTCPECGHAEEVEMSTNACQHFYKCTKCGEAVTPKEGDCCVFCSYADSKCPPKQKAELETQAKT